MDEREAEARPVMGTIFLVLLVVEYLLKKSVPFILFFDGGHSPSNDSLFNFLQFCLIMLRTHSTILSDHDCCKRNTTIIVVNHGY